MSSLTYYNFVCDFGTSDWTMLDLVQEIIFPALRDEEMVRRYGESRYFLDAVQISVITLDDATPRVVVRGRLIKDTLLRRVQVYTESDGLVRDEEELASAPSSFFALILDNHKLIWLPETASAPDPKKFALTLQQFFREKHDLLVDRLYDLRGLPEEQRTVLPQAPLGDSLVNGLTTKKAIRQFIPRPTVTITPLASRGSIEHFVQTFEVLQELGVELLPTNEELSMDETYRKLRERRESLAATGTKLSYRNPKGLKPGEVIDEIHAAAAAGNHKLRVAGKAPDGSKVRGDNESFKVRVSLEDIPERDDERASALVRSYDRQVEQGVVQPDLQPDSNGRRESTLSTIRDELL